MSRNVYKEDVRLVQPPEQALWEDRGLSLCAKPLLVLADTTDSAYYKNDRFSKAYKVDSIDNVQLEANDGTLYTAPYSLYTFPHQSDAEGFIIDWRQFLNGGVLRTGCYKVKVTYTLAGTTNSFYEGAFNLKNYSIFNARDTVRVWVDLNDLVRRQGINYRGSGFTTMIRFQGKFGWMQPNYDSENIVYVDDTTEKIRNEAIRTYELKSTFLYKCATRQIDEEILLTANRIRITDHNALNHDQFFDFEVILDEDKSPEFVYPEGGSVYARVLAYFKERVKDSESVYRGDIEGVGNVISLLPTGSSGCPVGQAINSDNSFTLSVPSGGTAPIPDSQINVNGVDQGDVVSVKTIDVNVTDGTDPVTPDSVSLVGNTLTVAVPSGGVPAIKNIVNLYALKYAYAFAQINYSSMNCFRVRRSSDNAEQDIGFVGREIDLVTLYSFVGSGNGFVTILYNQGLDGSLYDLSQSTAGNQPQIVRDGKILRDINGKYCAEFITKSLLF